MNILVDAQGQVMLVDEIPETIKDAFPDNLPAVTLKLSDIKDAPAKHTQEAD